MKTGIVIADTGEYDPFLEYIKDRSPKPVSLFGVDGHTFKIGETEVICLFSKIGKVNAAAACAYLISIGCDVILNFGYSGGVSGVSRGDYVICDRFAEHDFDLTMIGYKPFEKPWQEYIYPADEKLCAVMKKVLPFAKSGLSASGDSFVCDEGKRELLKTELGAAVCDMESAAAASVSATAGVPYVSVRKVSDDAGADASVSYRELNESPDIPFSKIVLDFLLEIAKGE